ncbi:hypothetical protein [Cuspidothrix issatschenkoi]|uniref:hypothetical protein n=1 Tax=Cuspidothrix issatschenkoi TaxID=230752 RepID=UPI001D135E07|nr:hypothetical protein [Cuspidothrix issatschenkoi]
MTIPSNIIGLASAATGGIAKGVTEVIKTKEHQKTIRLQNKTQAINGGAECLNEIVSAYYEYKRVVKEERTKCREIEAWEKTTLAEIEQKRDSFLAFLDHSFAERLKNFKALFNVVDQAIASGNNEHLQLALDKITELAKSNPFQDLANLSTVQAALLDPDHEWKF